MYLCENLRNKHHHLRWFRYRIFFKKSALITHVYCIKISPWISWRKFLCFLKFKVGKPWRNLTRCCFYLNRYHSNIFSSEIYNCCTMQMNSLLLSCSHNWNEILIPHLWLHKNPYGNWLCSQEEWINSSRRRKKGRGTWEGGGHAHTYIWVRWLKKRTRKNAYRSFVFNLNIFILCVWAFGLVLKVTFSNKSLW